MYMLNRLYLLLNALHSTKISVIVSIVGYLIALQKEKQCTEYLKDLFQSP